MGSWDAPLMDDMEFEIPHPVGDIVQDSSSAWDQHVMEIDYDVSQALFLVLDTNFLIRHLSLLKLAANGIFENGHLIPPLFFVLPGVVVDELDYQSKYGVREHATAATYWLQEQIELRLRTGRGSLRAQKEDETLRGGRSWRNLRGRGENDNIILDCCLYFSQLSGGQVRLLSQDRNLALKATISDIITMSVSKETSVTDFLGEIIPGVHFSPPSASMDRSSAASRWASSSARGSAQRVVAPRPSFNLSSYNISPDEDIDMEDMPYSHRPDTNSQSIYRRLAEDPLENFIKNLQYDNVLLRAAGATPYPESPRQTLSRISASIPNHVLYFVSERGEPGYRAGGIWRWSRGDTVRATSTLERLFIEMGKWNDNKEGDRMVAQRTLWDDIPDTMNRRQSIAVPSGTNKENGTRVARIKRAQSIGGPMDIRKGSSIGADGLSPRRRKRRSMVPRKSILKVHNEDDEQTMEITQVVGGIGVDMTMGRKSLARRVSFAAMAQVRMFEPTINSNASASSPSRSSPAQSSPAANTPNDQNSGRRSPVPMRRANSEEAGEASMELDDENSDRSMGDASFGAEEEPFDGGEGAGEDSMDLTDTYQQGTPSRRRSSAPMGPLPPLDRSMDRQRDNSHRTDDDLTEVSVKEREEFMVKLGKSIVPRRKSEAWAELQSLTHAGIETDEDSTGSTTNSEGRGEFIPSSQGTMISSQGTYSSNGTSSSQDSRTDGDRDMGLEDAISRLRAVRQSIGGGAADMSIDEDDDGSSSSGDYEGRFDDEDRTMDVTAVTGGLRFDVDDEDEEEAEAESAPGPTPTSTAQQTPSTAPAFAFTSQPEVGSTTARLNASTVVKLPTFAIDPPSPPQAQAPASLAPFAFTTPSSPKPVAKPTSAAVAPASTFSFDFAPLTAPTVPVPPILPPSSGAQTTSIQARLPTFEVSQSPVRAPPVTWSPRNAPGPFEFTLPSGGTPRRSSIPAAGLNNSSTPARATTPGPTGTPKAVETPARALSAPPTPKRPREEANEDESARKRIALGVSVSEPQPHSLEQPTVMQEKDKGTQVTIAKPPRRRSFAPRMSMSTLGRSIRGTAPDPIIPTTSTERSVPSVHAPSPPRPASPIQAHPQSPTPLQASISQSALSPPANRALSPRSRTPPADSSESGPREPVSSSLIQDSPRPAVAALEEIRISSPLRPRTSTVGTNMGAKSPAQWRTGVPDDAELGDIPSISASDFLRMTRISFMDGLTVKRRSTIGLGVLGRRKSGENQHTPSLRDYIVAMTVGVPQLETYNYAAKELKEYISNGKKAIRILEDDLDANNPYLFKEYLASGEEDRRAIEETLGGHKEAMRLRSKMSWYKWRHNFVTEMQAAADRETELLQQDLESLRELGNQLSEPMPSLKEQHAKLKAQLAAERAAVEAAKDCDPETMAELKTGITEQNAQIESYKTDIQASTTKLEKLKTKLAEVENDKRALLEQMRADQEKLDALHPTVEIVNLREEFEKLQKLHLWHAIKLEDKYIELRYDDHYRVQLECIAFKPIPSGCRILPIPPKGKQPDQFPVLSELVLELAQVMIRQATNLNLKKVIRMLGRLWTSVSYLRCSLRLLAMRYPVTITRADAGFGFKATTRVRFPASSGLAKITFIAQEQHIRDWGNQLQTLGVDASVVFGKLNRDLIIDAAKDRISDAVIEESYGLLLDACADAVACIEGCTEG